MRALPLAAGINEGGHYFRYFSSLVETAGGKQDRLQAQQLIDMASKHSLLQEVLEPTYSVEILDLIFTNNCELVSSVSTETWSTITDHRLIVVNTSFSSNSDDHRSNSSCVRQVGAMLP